MTPTTTAMTHTIRAQSSTITKVDKAGGFQNTYRPTLSGALSPNHNTGKIRVAFDTETNSITVQKDPCFKAVTPRTSSKISDSHALSSYL